MMSTIFCHEPELNMIGGGLEVDGVLVEVWVVVLLVIVEGKVSEECSEVSEDKE